MMNQVICIGRFVKVEDKGENAIITIANTKVYKNEEGVYETNIIDFVLWGNMKDNVIEYCNKGDIIGIKGRIDTNKENENILIAEKITFLSTNKESIKDE